jgi:hypothetical protein
MNDTTPRFTRSTARGGELTLAEPLPPTLTKLVERRAEQHRKVAARLVELQERVVETRRHLEQVKAEDVAKIEEAALSGKPMPKARSGGSAERRVEVAEEELASFESVVPRSADALLAAAWPRLGDAAERVADAQEKALARSRELLAAVDSSLAELQALADEESWLAYAANGARRVEPYRARGGDRQVGQLRGALLSAFDEFEARRAAFETERDRLAAFEREQEAERQRHEEQARRDDAARRVVTEDGRVVSRGGVPVGPRGEFQDAEDER